ncbi:MAG TPA: DUF4276 family protein [Candidatus Acidoferrum sp.]|nr:DUF4276 family protein [Candidatus Acidoferrum sp.]
MNLFIYVEGQEEEMFVNRVLRGHLRPFGVMVQKPILAATSFRIGADDDAEITVGGVTNYDSIRQDIVNQFAAGDINAADVLTTLIDLYGLPARFPGHEKAMSSGLTAGRKAEFVEQAWKDDIGHPNFFPYIQAHEFEALILTRPSALTEFYPEHSAGIEQLRKECASFRTPEDINEVKATSPSHRILARVPTYQKIDGFRHLQDIGLQELKAHCPRFKAWMAQCEKFFR